MIERKLNKEHDIFLINGNLSLVNGPDQIVQNIGVRLKFFQAEYFLDVTIGMPWYQQVLIRNVNIAQVESRIKLEILNTEGVTRVTAFNVEFDRIKRSLTVNFSAETIEGLTGEQEVILNG